MHAFCLYPWCDSGSACGTDSPIGPTRHLWEAGYPLNNLPREKENDQRTDAYQTLMRILILNIKSCERYGMSELLRIEIKGKNPANFTVGKSSKFDSSGPEGKSAKLFYLTLTTGVIE